MIYLDSGATSFQKPESVYRAVQSAMRTMSSPGRGAYEPAIRAAEEIYECRLSAAELFNVRNPENIIFTMNATHGLNIAIKSLVKPGDRVLISGFEHNSVLRPLIACGAELVTAGKELFNKDEFLEDFSRKIKSADCAVFTHVSNVFGYVLPVYEAAELAKKYSVPFIVDASQSAGILNVDAEKLGADYIAMPGHKGLFGPQGTGILICNHETKPLLEGGSGSDSASKFMPEYLPDRLEAGTHNVCGIAGLRAGIEFVKKKTPAGILSHERMLLSTMIKELSDSSYEMFSGEGQIGLISLRHPDISPDALADKLKAREICIRSGLHCAPLAHKSVGTDKTGTARFSFSPFVTQAQIKYCCRVMKQII